MRPDATPQRLLVGHFLRRMFDNDLVSPGEDQHRVFAGLLGGAITIGVLGVGFLMMKYSPSGISLGSRLALAVDDRAFFTGCAMVLMALATVLVWDGLVLDRRDYAILGPLPLEPRQLVLAKVAALAAFVVAFALVLTLVPSVLFPLVVLMSVPAGTAFAARMIGAQLASSLTGCLFAFLAIVAIRGVVVVLLRRRLSRAVLPLLQFVLVLALLSSLLLLPWLADDTHAVFESTAPADVWWPPLWFAGLYEVLVGHQLPVTRWLAGIAAMALAGTTLVATITYAAAAADMSWSPGDAAEIGARRDGPLARLFRIVSRLSARQGAARASFAFTAHALARNARPRLWVAGGLGAGLALTIISLAVLVTDLGGAAFSVPLPTTMAIQFDLVYFALVGARMAAATPAELNANWIFRLNTRPVIREHLVGSRRAVFCTVAAPLLLALIPVHAALWGWRIALLQLAGGLLMSALLIYALFLGHPRAPFASPVVARSLPLAARVPLFLVGYWVFVAPTVTLMHYSLREPTSLIALGLLVAVTFGGMATAQRWWLRQVPALVLGEDDSGATQTLGLAD